MAKRDNGTKRKSSGTATSASDATTPDEMQQRVLAFAEQVGRIAGTLQAKAEGWMERETLNRQIASVRDVAANLLEQLAGDSTKTSKMSPLRWLPDSPSRSFTICMLREFQDGLW